MGKGGLSLSLRICALYCTYSPVLSKLDDEFKRISPQIFERMVDVEKYSVERWTSRKLPGEKAKDSKAPSTAKGGSLSLKDCNFYRRKKGIRSRQILSK